MRAIDYLRATPATTPPAGNATAAGGPTGAPRVSALEFLRQGVTPPASGAKPGTAPVAFPTSQQVTGPAGRGIAATAAAPAQTRQPGRRPAEIGNELFQADAGTGIGAIEFLRSGARRLGLTPAEAARSVPQALAAPARVSVDLAKLFPYAGLAIGGATQQEWLKKASRTSLAELNKLKQRLTFVDEGLTDTAMSMLIGGASGAGMRAWMEMGKPMARLARAAGISEPLFVTGVKSGLVTAAGDKLVIDPALSLIDEKVGASGLNPKTKELVLSIAPLVLGAASGMTIEARIDRMLKNPLALRWLDDAAQSNLNAEAAAEKFRRQVSGRIWSEAGSGAETAPSAFDDARQALRLKQRPKAPQQAPAAPQAQSSLKAQADAGKKTLRGRPQDKPGRKNPWEMTTEDLRAQRDWNGEDKTQHYYYHIGKPHGVGEGIKATPWGSEGSNVVWLSGDRPLGGRTGQVYAVDPMMLPNGAIRKARTGNYFVVDGDVPASAVVDLGPRTDVHERFDVHRAFVENALRKGKQVPPEVLADYPDLAEMKRRGFFSEMLVDDALAGAAAPDQVVDQVRDQVPDASVPGTRPSGRFEPPRVAPNVGVGLLTGTMAGVDREALDRGELKVDYRKFLAGAAAGAASTSAITRAYKALTWAGDKWDKKFATPLIDTIKRTVDGLVVNEHVRHAFGMNRSKAFGDRLRDYYRSAEQVWDKAAEIGAELKKIAPSRLEQRRLMQVIRGGVTASPVLREKAHKVNELFSSLRDELKRHQLLEYSRFDKLTKAERTRLRHVINGHDPAATPEDIEFARSRLHDYYHFGSAQEYAPAYYNVKEGLTPKQRRSLEDEIKRLKYRSRLGNPEGREDLENQIAQMEKILRRKTGGREMRTRRTALNQGYAHRRQEMPPEVVRLLGRIEEAAFPVAKGIGTQASDLAKARLFKEIAENPDWARPREWWGRGDAPGARWVKVEDGRFGALKDKFVRRDVWDDLRQVEEWRSAFVKKYDQLLSAWKYGKVVLNPATHVRNSLSNMILAYFGDVSPLDTGTYMDAMKAVIRGEDDRFYKEAAEWGLFNNTFATTEVMKLRDQVENLRDGRTIRNWFREVMSVPTRMYQGNEELFKLAVFIKARRSGMDVDKAARKAEKFLFNYADIPPIVKHAKRWVSPFLTFTYKAVPLYAEMAIRKPWKVAAITAAMYGMEKFAHKQLGMTEDDADSLRAMMPDWQQRRVPAGMLPLSFLPQGVADAVPLWMAPYSQVMMPFRDKWGNALTLDLSYILPYGNLAEKWGQSALPLSDIMPSSPLFQTAAAILTNTDPFTGNEIYTPLVDGASDIAQEYLKYAWREIAPSLAPGGHGWDKLSTGIQNSFMGRDVRDWADRPVEFQTAALSALLGIKLTPANESKLRQFEMRTRDNIKRNIGRKKSRLKRDYERNKITRDEFMKQARELNDLKRQILQERARP